ncbi:MAG: hypothetical protein V1834_00090 [Candidatus Micrarchaeota archaeon]
MLPRVLFFALLFALLAGAYTDESLTVTIQLNPDGTARVFEKTIFNLDNEQEEAAFDYALGLGETTLLDWSRFSKNIHYHLRSSQNLRITAKREFDIRFTAASVILQYDTGVITSFEAEGRKTNYVFDPEILVFSRSQTSEITLGNGESLLIELPAGADATRYLPEPSSFENRKLVWQGPLSGAMALEFTVEKSLSQEVNEFFVSTFDELRSSYVWLLVAVFVIIAGVKLLQVTKE